MEAVAGLLLLLMMMMTGVSQETSCDGRQDGAQCVGALGGAVDVQLVDNALEIHRLDWRKDDSIIIQWRNKHDNIKDNRFLFTPSTGTVRINNLKRNDSGEYKLLIYNTNGTKSGQRTLQLSVQAGVSSVQLVSECLSQGQKQVSCSSEEGDSPQYSWTLDGHTLTDSELLSGNNQTNIIILRQNISGRLVCSVRNQVSESSRDEDISTCGFIFINCTSHGTHISEWVFRENNTLCDEPTPVPTAVTHSGGKETELTYSSTINSSSNQNKDLISFFSPSPLLICGLRFLLVVLLLLSIWLYFTWRKKKQEKDQSSANSEDRDNAVMMVEMSSAS